MNLKKPKFWDQKKPNILAYLLLPVSFLLDLLKLLRFKKKIKKSKIKTIIVGNIYLGGTGKTSLSIRINELLSERKIKSCFVKNFYPNQYNEQIRTRILDKESELSTGDFLMVVKNNYFWLDTTSEAGFIANGDIIEVLEIFAIKELYGFRFAEVKVRMVDYPNQKPFETTLLLDTIAAESPSLSYEDGNKLYQAVSEDYTSEKSNYKRFLGIKNNKYFNALQVKFSYAITCHKSQGGQWDTVFVEQPYLPNGIDKEYLRWLYTAITRAKKKLYLIGFKEDFFEEN